MLLRKYALFPEIVEKTIPKNNLKLINQFLVIKVLQILV